MNELQPISIVIPMYNEVDNVEPLITEIQQALQQHPAYEIVIADDGSNDGTFERLSQLKSSVPQLTIVRHDGNFGQSAATVSGVRKAQYPWIVTLDGDGQNDPADIPTLLNVLNEVIANDTTEAVFIAGNRRKRNDTFIRKLSSRVANHVRTGLLKDDCLDTGCSLKLFSREDFLRLPHFNHLHRFLPSLFKRAGGKIYNVKVNHRPRLSGQSKYGMMNRLWVGIVDLFGVMWLMRRPCNPKVEEV